MRERLQPIELADFSAGLNKFASSQLVDNREMTESENIRHIGNGRLKRRGGMGLFSTAAIEPQNASTTERYGRAVISYIRRVRNFPTKQAFIESVAVINNLVYRCADGISATQVRLQTGNPVYNYSQANAQMPWKPYNTQRGNLYYEDNFQNVGRAFLDNRIYLGNNLTDENWTSAAGDVLRNLNFPWGIALAVSNSAIFANLGNTITGQTSGATGILAARHDTRKTLFLYNWNGVPFADGETVDDGAGNSSPVSRSSEFALNGMILENEGEPTSAWKARKWGINAPLAALSANPDTSVGSVTPDTYNIKYTFIRYEGGSMGTGNNPKLSGGELISESAPSPEVSVTQTDEDKCIQYYSWEESFDPQVTHVRFYRDDGYESGVFRHVADAALDAANVLDGMDTDTLEFEAVAIETDGFKTFGEDGENSGFVIESGKRRIFVAGNTNYPNRIYISPNRTEHRFSEYFNTGFDITESPGETITAMKWWNNILYIFLERSVYRMVEKSYEGFGTFTGHEIVSRGIGCATRNGVLDMGDYLLVMTAEGLFRFNGTTFDVAPLTLKVDDILGKDLLNAQIGKSDEYVYIITETSRASNLLITMKFSDGSFALGTDRIDSSIEMPEAFDFVPELTNFGNTVDDSNYMLSLFRNPDDSGVKYWHVKYDALSENKDRLMLSAGSTQKTIVVKWSPKVFDFGAFVQCTLEKLIAYISSCGDESSSFKPPTGEWLVKMYIDQAKDGTAVRYEEVKLKMDFARNKTLTEGAGGPIQTKYTKPFDATYPHQTGGVWSNPSSPNALLADFQKILFRANLPSESIGRIWKLVFLYQDEQNFEFNSFALKFVREEGSV